MINTLAQQIQKALTLVQATLSPARQLHTQGVAETAQTLARSAAQADPGLDLPILSQQARLAAYLHDLAKELTDSTLLKQIQQTNYILTPLEQQNPQLIHAEISALIAQEQLQVTDQAVLSAVRKHTLGSVQMSTLDKIIFVADAIEPNRPNAWADPIRKQLETNGLDAAVLACCQSVIQHVLAKKQTIHPRTIETYNSHIQNI